MRIPPVNYFIIIIVTQNPVPRYALSITYMQSTYILSTTYSSRIILLFLSYKLIKNTSNINLSLNPYPDLPTLNSDFNSDKSRKKNPYIILSVTWGQVLDASLKRTFNTPQRKSQIRYYRGSFFIYLS